MMLSVSPIADSARSRRAPPADRGGDDQVERQLPRNSRIIRLVSAAAITPSRATPVIARAHEHRLVADRRSSARRQRGL
jgi:hypothetical protein